MADSEDKTETAPEEQTPSPVEEKKASDKKELSETPDVVEGSPKDEAEKQTSVEGQTSSPEGEKKSSEREESSETPEEVGGSPKDKAETALEDQTPSPVDEKKESDKKELSETPDDVGGSPKEKAETALEKQKKVEDLAPSIQQEKPSDEREMYKTQEDVGVSQKGGIFVIIAVVLIAIPVGYFFTRNTGGIDMRDTPTGTIRCDPHKEDCTDFLSQSIKNLSEKYTDQESNSWRTLHAAALSHVTPQPKPVRPIVILVYWVNSSNDQILFDIGKVYTSLLPGSKDDANIVIQGKQFVGQESESVQKKISEQLELGFNNGRKVAIIHDFDDLPSCSVLTFHNYCNNDDAPYTNVAIILTMKGNPDMKRGQKPKILEESVSDIFHEKWSDCPEDLPPGKIDAILSRVANNVVLLR